MDNIKKEFEVEGEEGTWHGREMETGLEEATRMYDEAKGEKLILRHFTFTVNPEVKVVPTKQELFNSHWPQIKIMLWGDGLVASQAVAPRVVMGSDTYQIFILCEPKANVAVIEKTKTLQEVFKPLDK